VDAHTGQIISSNDIITYCDCAPHTGADHKHLSTIGGVPTTTPATSVTADKTNAIVSDNALIGSGTTLYYGVQQFPTETDPVTNTFRLESGPARQNYIVQNALLRNSRNVIIDFIRALKPGSNNSNWTSTTAELTALKFKFTEMPGNLEFKNCGVRIQDISNKIIFDDIFENFQLNQEYQFIISPPLPLLLGTDYKITFYDKNPSTSDSVIDIVNLEASTGLVQFNIDFNNTIIGTGSMEATAGISGALDVAFGISKTLDYFKNVHGRNGYDNSNGRITAYIHSPTSVMAMNNAGFNSKTGELFLGEGSPDKAGPLCSLDIIGHEITHGVIDTSAELSNIAGTESAALIESFADIFGTAIEFNTPSAGTPNWLIADRTFRGAGANYIRSMSNPKAKGHPDFYKGTNWLPLESHKNAGVQNRWFYLLSEGGSGTNEAGDNYNVQGIGIKKAEKIAYRNLTNYLSPKSDYRNAYEGSLLAAENLHGKNSSEYKSVADAWYAVGLPGKMKITSFTPETGLAAEPPVPGTEVTITGENFIGITDIKFNTTFTDPSDLININEDYTQIKVKVPKGATTGKIILVAGKNKVKTATKFYIDPIITSFTPKKGFASTNLKAGTEITINGKNFTDATRVYFGETLAKGFEINSKGTKITKVRVPRSAITGRIKVVRTPDAFGVSKKPFIVKKTAINSLEPAEGKIYSSVKIIGEYFENIAQVKFNGTLADEFSVNNAGTEIIATVPLGATTGSVTVVTEYEEAEFDSFNVVKPIITSFSNLSGEVGDVVTIRGQNFQNLVEVYFNGVPTSLFQVNSDFTIATVTVPAKASTGLIGVKDLVDTAFSDTDFIMPPRIIDFTPKKGPIGTSVTITGKNFLDVTQVKFNGTLTTAFSVNPEGTEITTTVPDGATTGKILVTGPSGYDESTIDFQVPINISLSGFACSISSHHACAVYYDENNINIGNYDFIQKYYRSRLYFGCSTSGSFFDFQNFEIAGVKLNKSRITGNGSTTTTFIVDGLELSDDASIQEKFMVIKNYLSGTGPKIITGTLAANGVYFTATLPNHVNGAGISSGDNCISSAARTSSSSLEQAAPGLKKLETAITAISLHPNPTNGDTTLDLPNPKEVTQVSITDMAGTILWQTSAVQAETVLPVAGFKTSTYLVTVGYKNSESETLKLVKQ